MNMSMNIPTHPFVECNIEGVNAHALIDTGSMKSFIRQDIYNTIDFEGTRLGKVNEQCKSITGDPLNLLGKLNASVKFIGSRYSYSDNFLVSSDIQFDCILGWDFLVNNQLTVQRDTSGGISFYSLTGPHGKTRVCAKAVSNATHLSGVVESGATTNTIPDCGMENGTDSYLFYQSQYKAPIEVYLSDDIVIPSRSEVIVEGKLVKTTTANVGMIESIPSRTQEQGIHISHMVAHPKGKTVPLRIMNTSLDPVELTSGRKVAQFHQLLTSKVKMSEFVSTSNTACSVTNSTVDFESQVQESISPHLNGQDRAKLTQLLRNFSDIFGDKLSKCNVTSHKINTGKHLPIKQRPRRLPYAYREESEKQIKEMLEMELLNLVLVRGQALLY